MDWSTYTDDLNIPNNWDCTSYNNDELPSFQVNGLHIWIDSHDIKERTINSSRIIGCNEKLMPRFTVQTATSYNCFDDDHSWIFETNTFQELLEFVRSKKQWKIFKNDTWITNPFYDETGRFFVNPIEYYGLTKKDLNEYGSIN